MQTSKYQSPTRIHNKLILKTQLTQLNKVNIESFVFVKVKIY